MDTLFRILTKQLEKESGNYICDLLIKEVIQHAKEEYEKTNAYHANATSKSTNGAHDTGTKSISTKSKDNDGK